ncbi:MAG: hypothetical protein OEX81_05885 [Candidatus Pacebacteria bacterium]|nr:hypothetical protein [Candidatus Paceibacterota bacterium]
MKTFHTIMILVRWQYSGTNVSKQEKREEVEEYFKIALNKNRKPIKQI